MPSIAIMRAHGSNDFPLHVAFFSHLEKAGALDKFDFLLDPMTDLGYCLRLIKRFPQLRLTEDVSRPRRWMREVAWKVGRGFRPFGYLDKFDAVCEAPGGRITELYQNRGLFRLYPRVKHRAVIFHSIEAGALKNPDVRRSIAGADLIVARTAQSARNAEGAGAKHVVEAADVVFLEHPRESSHRPGVAAALRLPNDDVTQDYTDRLREIVDKLEETTPAVDFVRVEEPFGQEMIARGLGTYMHPKTGLYGDDSMYLPFLSTRDAVISSRLHTTLLALIYGNRKILQYQIEGGTRKAEEVFNDIGLKSIKMHGPDDVRWSTVEEFLQAGPDIPEQEARDALDFARAKAQKGFDAFLEWLDTIK